MVKTGIERGTAWRQQCADGVHGAVLLLDAELRAKITDTKMFLNVLCCLVVYVVVQVFTKNAGLTCIISHMALMIFAGINYFVYLFRGNEFIFSDLRSISTGLSVAGNYEFVLDDRAVYVALLSVLYVAFVRKIHVNLKKGCGWQWYVFPLRYSAVLILEPRQKAL